VVSGPSFGLNEVNGYFLLSSFAPHARPLKVVDSLMFSQRRADVFLRSTGLERRLSFLEVASVVLGTNEGKHDDVRGHTSDKDALDQSVVRHVLRAIRFLNRRAGVLSGS